MLQNCGGLQPPEAPFPRQMLYGGDTLEHLLCWKKYPMYNEQLIMLIVYYGNIHSHARICTHIRLLKTFTHAREISNHI